MKTRLGLVLPILFACAPLTGQSFVQGDLYVYNPATFGLSSNSGAITRVDPSTGAATTLITMPASESYGDMIAWDPFRGGLIMCGNIGSPFDPRDTYLLDAAGNAQSFGHPGIRHHAFAPTGDGKIYMRVEAAPVGRIHYFDAAGVRTVLYDESGTQPFQLLPGAPVGIRRMMYHAPTHSLVAAASSFAAQCGSGTGTGVNLYRMTLSPDGTRVVGPVRCAEFEVSTSFEEPVGLSAMPDGSIFVVVDTLSNAAEPRMLRLDPNSMNVSVFATNDHPVAASIQAGVWSSRLGRGLIFDTFLDAFRSYQLGEAGPGTVVTPTGAPVSTPGSPGETATVIEVGPSTCGGHFETYGNGLAGTGGFFPTISGSGCPEPLGPIELHLSSGLGGAAGALLLGDTRTSFGFLGGTILVVPTASIPLSVGGTPGLAGAGHLTIPAVVGAPTVFDLQWLVLDPGAIQTLAMSGGLEIVVAP